MAHVNTRKLPGNELSREFIFCDHDGINDEKRKLRVYRNQFTKGKFRITDPNKNILKRDKLVDTAEEAEVMIHDLLLG